MADILTLAALAVACLGHLAPWIGVDVEAQVRESGVSAERVLAASDYNAVPGDLQLWHAMRSGAALALAGVLVGVSLTSNLGIRMRKILVLLTFACVLAAVVFQILIFSPYPLTEAHRSLALYSLRHHPGFLMALIPSLIAAGLCLVRMLWTMTAAPQKENADETT